MNGITLGTFDLFHYGHVRLLKRCREMCDYLTVAINSDEFIWNYKQTKPVMRYKERYMSVEETGIADQVIQNVQLFPHDAAKDTILNSESNLIIIGSDWGRKEYLKQLGITWEWMDEHDISLAYVPYTWEISTTEIKKRCKLV